MKRIIVLFAIGLLCLNLQAQNKIIGKITDQDNQVLPGTTIFIPEMNKGTVSDKNGQYELLNLPNGKLKILFSFIGYSNVIETVVLNETKLELNVVMKLSPIEAEQIVISGGYSATQHENAVKIDILKVNTLQVKSTPNFMEVLTKVPGVDMISKGPGVSKPVIRGLSMNDILVLNNGVRFENYQYSSHHPLGIDEFGIKNVEVIKGPASLLYGSDAIGGVINFIKEKPATVGTIKGDYNLQLFSNTLGMTNNLGIKGASKKFFGGIRAGQKTNSDFIQGGGDYVPNSRFNEWSLKANAGYTAKAGTFKLYYDYNEQKLGLVEDEALEEIIERGRANEIFYQQLNTHLISSQNKIYLNKVRLEVNSAYQSTELAHFGEPDVYEIQMRLGTFTYETRLHLPSDENSEYIIGLQGFNQTNTNVNDRETILLPDANTSNYSGFGLIQHTFLTRLKLQAGIRYDYKNITTQKVGLPEDAEYRSALKKDYGSFSGSFGATYNLSEVLLFRANFAVAYRTPNLAELTSNGPHETRYEVGAPDLVPENSLEGDVNIHFHKPNYSIDIAGFYNSVRHYIFISPTGDTTTDGMSIYMYNQNDAALFGGESGLHIHPEPLEWLHFETTFASVIGKQKNGEYLPFIPAHKLNFELRGEVVKMAFLHKPFLSIHTCTAFDQNNAAPDETVTNGYTLVDLSLGGQIKAGNQYISVGFSVNNLLDKKYIDHLSTLKEVNMQDPGRNITINIKVPFGLTILN
jgi:iron complex outermembrane receptor protein